MENILTILCGSRERYFNASIIVAAQAIIIIQMGIQQLKPLTQNQIYSSSQTISAKIHGIYQILPSAQLSLDEDPNYEIIYSSKQPIREQYILRQSLQNQQQQSLDEYLYTYRNPQAHRLQTTISKMQQTGNMYIPYQIRNKITTFCNRVYDAQILYPLYEYRLRPELQARQNRKEYFYEKQIWFLMLSVLEVMREFQIVKGVSGEFSIDDVRFNAIGRVKVDNILSSPAKLESLKDHRMFWSRNNPTHYYVQETYRLALVVLELCSFQPIEAIMKLGNGAANYAISEASIKRALEITRIMYSDLLYKLLNAMLCHPRDRPLPSQIYQLLYPFKNQIVQFKQFSFQPKVLGSIQANLNSSYFSVQTLNYAKPNRQLAQQNNQLKTQSHNYPRVQSSFHQDHKNRVLNSPNPIPTSNSIDLPPGNTWSHPQNGTSKPPQPKHQIYSYSSSQIFQSPCPQSQKHHHMHNLTQPTIQNSQPSFQMRPLTGLETQSLLKTTAINSYPPPQVPVSKLPLQKAQHIGESPQRSSSNRNEAHQAPRTPHICESASVPNPSQKNVPSISPLNLMRNCGRKYYNGGIEKQKKYYI